MDQQRIPAIQLFRRGQAKLAVVMLIVALGHLWVASRMPLGVPAEPGPAPFPVAVGVTVSLLSLALLLQAARERGGLEQVIFPAGEAGKRVVGIWLALATYVVFVGTLGHALLTGIVSVAILHLLGMRRWWVVILLAVALAIGTHYLFVVVLGVPLPEGTWVS